MNTRIARSPLFSLLDDEDAVEAIARQAGSAAVLSGDGELNGHMRRIAALVEAPDRALATYEVLGLLLGLQRRDLSCARPRFILTRAQMRIVAAVHDELEGSLDCAHDARVLASAFGLSAATLNQYFSRAYGSTVAGYLRKRRMEVAAALLARGMRVAEAAVRVGYANPSKFSSAFKRGIRNRTERVEAASIRREGGRSRSQGGVLGTLTRGGLPAAWSPSRIIFDPGILKPVRAGAERA